MNRGAAGALALAPPRPGLGRARDAVTPASDVIRILDVEWHGGDLGEASLDCLARRFADAAAGLLDRWVGARNAEPGAAVIELALALDTVTDAGARMLRQVAFAHHVARRPGDGPRDRQGCRAIGWDALTSAEQRVARLAAQGLTNPQIGAPCSSAGEPSRRTCRTSSASSAWTRAFSLPLRSSVAMSATADPRDERRSSKSGT